MPSPTQPPKQEPRPCLGRASSSLLCLALWSVLASSVRADSGQAEEGESRVETVASAVTVEDIRGRTVTLPAGPRRLLIDDGRYLLALSLLHPDPVGLVAAWPHDSHRIGEEAYQAYLEMSPGLDDLPRVASSASSFSLEQAIAARPTVAVFTLDMGPSDAQVRRLESAGIPVVFVDFFSHPLDHVDRSVQILGAVVGRQVQAERFVDLRRERRDLIADRLAQAGGAPPDVFLEAHAGISPECCNSPGKGNVGDYIVLAGGHNIGADVLPGATGRLSLEYVLDRNPDVWVLTGGPHLARTNGLVLGSGYTAEEARAALRRMADRQGLRFLSAVETGRVHALSHQLLNSPLDVVALELLARWIRPELFHDLEPGRTLDRINREFLAVPLKGTHWATLPSP